MKKNKIGNIKYSTIIIIFILVLLNESIRDKLNINTIIEKVVGITGFIIVYLIYRFILNFMFNPYIKKIGFVNNLRIKFKLVKEQNITPILNNVHISFVEVITDEIEIREEIIKEQKAEIIMFFWFLGVVPFLKGNENETLKKTLKENEYEFIFDDLKDEYDNTVFDDIFAKRKGFYNKLINSKSDLNLQYYLKKASNFIFVEPFEDISEDENYLEFDNDFIKSFEKNENISVLYNNLLPKYIEILKKISLFQILNNYE